MFSHVLPYFSGGDKTLWGGTATEPLKGRGAAGAAGAAGRMGFIVFDGNGWIRAGGHSKIFHSIFRFQIFQDNKRKHPPHCNTGVVQNQGFTLFSLN